MSTVELMNSLEEKMLNELKSNNTYEALQYVQSFVARKKKTVPSSTISALVYHGAQLLATYEAASYAGTLLTWFIDGGAGEDHPFHVNFASDGVDSYCDIQRLSNLLSANPADKSALIIDAAYKHVTQFIDVMSHADKASSKLQTFEELCGDLLEHSSNWRSAYTSHLRSGRIERAAKVLDSWSQEANPSEKPLFFARAALQLYANGNCKDGKSLVHYAHDYIVESNTHFIAAWHFAQIVSELEELPSSNSGLDKAKIFGVLIERYNDALGKLDEKLPQLAAKVGYQVFRYQSAQKGFDPFAMLQAFSGGKKGPGGIDMNNIMSMLGGMSMKK
jgi:hypothetical protein